MKCLQVLVLGVTLIAVANADDSVCMKQVGSGAGDSAPCTKNKNDKCAAVFDYTNDPPVFKELGCKEDLNIKCDTANVYCIECEGKNCNQGKTKAVQVPCYKCDSKTDKNCVKAPSTVTTEKGYLCSTTLLEADADGSVHNVRAAINSEEALTSCKNSEKCKLCDKASCNIDEPLTRNKCATDICLKPSDSCVATYKDTGAKDKELCAAENTATCAAAGRLCLKCEAGKACEADISNSCYTCPATGSCDVTSAETPLVHSCTGCSINIAADGKTTRKCADKEECKSSLNCKKCTGMLCNSNEVKSNTKKCYQCNKEKEGCGKQLNATAVENTDCTAKTIGGFDLCYAFRKEINRGCLSSLIASDDYGKCTADGECDVCPDDGCNKQDINASAIATGAILLVAFGVLAASITN